MATDDRSNQAASNQAAMDAQKTQAESGQYAGGNATLDAEAALSEQGSQDPMSGTPAATNITSGTQDNPNAAPQNSASGYPIDTAQGDGDIATTDVTQGDSVE